MKSLKTLLVSTAVTLSIFLALFGVYAGVNYAIHEIEANVNEAINNVFQISAENSEYEI